MGHQLNPAPTNGHNGSAAGPSTSSNGASSSRLDVAGISPLEFDTKLMYGDDHDWAMYQSASQFDAEEHPGQGDAEAVIDGLIVKPTIAKGPAAAKRMPVDRQEVVRLMLQGLRDIGYNQAADVLEAESGFQLSTTAAADFQAAIYGGRWSEAVQLLDHLGLPSPPASEPSSSGISVASGKMKDPASGTGSSAEQARFLIAQQKYLEFLELGQQKKALAVLRGELALLTKDSEHLHLVSGYLMCLNKDELYQRACWDGAAGTSRRQLLESLQAFISPNIMLPPRRLATLLDQARRYQQQSCVYHDENEPSTLYADHECKNGQFPTITTHILADHTDEVWRLEWSPNGMMLASSGKDQKVVLWRLKVKTLEDGSSAYSMAPVHHLEHREPIDSMAWSPDGKTLVTAAFNKLYLWNTETGTQIALPPGSPAQTDNISAIRWKPDGSEFLVSSMCCKLVFYDPRGAIKRQWSFGTLQIYDFCFTGDNKSIVVGATSLKRVAADNKLKPAVSALIVTEGSPLPRDLDYGAMEHNIATIRLDDKEITSISHDLKSTISSLAMSHDNKRVLVSAGTDLQIWGLQPKLHFIRSFAGFVHTQWLIKSGFAATKDRFVISGSEDGNVYVWQTSTAQSIAVLQGHDSSVNAVAWNPVLSRRIFASCSDDSTIRIWQPRGGMDEDEIKAEQEYITFDEDGTVGEDPGMVL